MKKKLTQLIILIIILTATGFYLVKIGSRGEAFIQEGQPSRYIQDLQSPDHQATQAAMATATYGAQQFYLQLTAVADEQ